MYQFAYFINEPRGAEMPLMPLKADKFQMTFIVFHLFVRNTAFFLRSRGITL